MSLTAPLQSLFRWMDEHPAVRLVLAVATMGVALLAPLAPWMLDAWVIVSLGAAGGMAVLFLLVGSELSPAEGLAGVPGYLFRFAFHRLALAVALTRAILLERSPGAIVDWVAHHALARHLGVGLAVVAVLYVARLGLALQHQGDRLRWLQSRPEADPAELGLLVETNQILGLLRRQSWLGAGLAVCFLLAGLATGLWVQNLPVGVTLMNYTIYGLAEAAVSAVPGLLIGLAVSHWLREARPDTGEPEAPEAAEAPSFALEANKETASGLRRSFPAVLAMVRARAVAELGLPLPRVGVVTTNGLPTGLVRVSLRGLPVAQFDLAEGEPVELLASEFERFVTQEAARLLTIEATAAMLDELGARQPVLVETAKARLGLPALHGVLQGLLREQVPIRDLAGVLEALVVAEAGSPSALIDAARQAIAPSWLSRLVDETGAIAAYELDAAWWGPLAAADGALEPGLAAELARALSEARLRSRLRQARTVLVVPRRHRRLVAELLNQYESACAVLAPEEISSRYPLRRLGAIKRLPAVTAQ